MAPMRNYLRSLGVDARHWGLGTNQGDPERDREIMLGRISDLVAELGKPVVLVGWSLGGVIAREIAREEPELVSRVITYGTPVIGGPSYTTAARAFGREECERITQLSEELDRDDPIQVPIKPGRSSTSGSAAHPASTPQTTHSANRFRIMPPRYGSVAGGVSPPLDPLRRLPRSRAATCRAAPAAGAFASSCGAFRR